MGMLFNKAKSASPFERPSVLGPVDPGMTMPQPVASMPPDAMPAPRRMGLFGAPMVPGMAGAPERLVSDAPDLSQLGPGIDLAQTKYAPRFNEPGGWGDKLSVLAAALMGAAGNQAGANAVIGRFGERRRLEQEQLARNALWQRQDSQRAQDRQWQVEDRDFAANRPQYFMSNEDRVAFDPTTGTSSVVYDGPTAAESYAGALGYEEGTPDYTTALRDYVLRGSGPSATAFRSDLEDQRQGNRVALKGVPTYSQLNPRAPTGAGGRGAPPRAPTMAGTMAPILAKVAKGQPLTPAEEKAWSMYRPGRRAGAGGGRGVTEGATATGPNGQKLVRRGGQWIPLR